MSEPLTGAALLSLAPGTRQASQAITIPADAAAARVHGLNERDVVNNFHQHIGVGGMLVARYAP